MEFSSRILVSQDWLTFLLTGCFLLLAASKYLYPRRFSLFLKLPINDAFFKVYGKEHNLRHPFNIILFVIQIVSVSVFVYLFLETFQFSDSSENPYLFLHIATIFTVFVLLKFSVEKIVAAVFSIEPVIDRYLFHKLGIRNYAALILFGIDLLLVYAVEPRPQIMLGIAVLLVFISIIGLVYSYNKNRKLIASNLFQFILYLCTLEISPYIILYKLLFIEVIT